MKRLLAFLLSLAVAGAASAQTLQPPEVAAKSYLLVDLSSNQTLAEREADAPGLLLQRGPGLDGPVGAGKDGEAGVDRELGKAKLGAASMRPRLVQQLAEGVPGFGVLGAAFDHDMID